MPLGRILCIDYGRARIGAAYSDASRTIAFPLRVFLKQKKIEETLKEIQKAIASLGTFDLLLVGLPLLLSGAEGEMAGEAKAFGALLGNFLSIPPVFWDERLTSCQADRILQEGDLSRKERAKLSDTVSASLILQSYLDRESLLKRNSLS